MAYFSSKWFQIIVLMCLITKEAFLKAYPPDHQINDGCYTRGWPCIDNNEGSVARLADCSTIYRTEYKYMKHNTTKLTLKLTLT